MKLSRDEFKEFVGLYKDAWEDFCKYTDIIQDSFLSDLIFPAFDWVCEKAGLKSNDIHSDWDLILHLVSDNWVYIPNPEDEEDWIETNNLDKIYDYYLGGN